MAICGMIGFLVAGTIVFLGAWANIDGSDLRERGGLLALLPGALIGAVAGGTVAAVLGGIVVMLIHLIRLVIRIEAGSSGGEGDAQRPHRGRTVNESTPRSGD